MRRSLLLKIVLVTVLLALLAPALFYLASPWWAPPACRWAADRFWNMDLKFATATLNPFTMELSATGGTFRGPDGEKFIPSGDLSRFTAEIDIIPLVRERKIKSVLLELASLKVRITGGKKSSFLPSHYEYDGVNDVVPAAWTTENEGSNWLIESFLLRIDRGILHYSSRSKKSEVSVDLDLEERFENVSDVRKLAGEVLERILTSAAYGLLKEKI